VKRAIEWFATNHVAANLIMFLLIVGGLSSLPSIHQKIFPDINIEVIAIGVPYLGAAPEEVEEGVCIRIEEEIQGIEGIEQIRSSAAEGACGVSAELISGYPIDRALAEIKNAVDGITTLPEETEKPTVSHVSYRRNALKLALSGDVSEKTLKILGERIRDRISALPGVTQVDLSNARNYEISIELPEESLRRYGLSFDQVVQAVRRGSLDRPGGSIKTSSGEVLLRTKGQAYTGEEFERIVVHTREDGTRLLLGEVAQVVDGFEDDDRWARFDGEPAVLIQVYRVGEQRVLELVERVKAYVDGAEARLPEGVKLTVWQNSSQTLRDRLDILIRNGVGGFILVFVVLALFLRLRLAFWVSISVPLSFLGALWLFPVLDISIDVVSLFAFITVLGLLVDDAIVVGENIHRHQERAEKPLEAAIRGAQEVSVPVIFGVLTTMAAFVPLGRSGGVGAGHLRRAHHDGGLRAPGALARRDGAGLRRHRGRGDRLPLLLAAGVAARAADSPRAPPPSREPCGARRWRDPGCLALERRPAALGAHPDVHVRQPRAAGPGALSPAPRARPRLALQHARGRGRVAGAHPGAHSFGPHALQLLPARR